MTSEQLSCQRVDLRANDEEKGAKERERDEQVVCEHQHFILKNHPKETNGSLIQLKQNGMLADNLKFRLNTLKINQKWFIIGLN